MGGRGWVLLMAVVGLMGLSFAAPAPDQVFILFLRDLEEFRSGRSRHDLRRHPRGYRFSFPSPPKYFPPPGPPKVLGQFPAMPPLYPPLGVEEWGICWPLKARHPLLSFGSSKRPVLRFVYGVEGFPVLRRRLRSSAAVRLARQASVPLQPSHESAHESGTLQHPELPSQSQENPKYLEREMGEGDHLPGNFINPNLDVNIRNRLRSKIGVSALKIVAFANELLMAMQIRELERAEAKKSILHDRDY